MSEAKKAKKEWRKAVSSTQIRLKKGAAEYFKKQARYNEPIGATVCRLSGIDENGNRIPTRLGNLLAAKKKVAKKAAKPKAKAKKAKGGKHAKRTKSGSKKAARPARKR